ncbi:hypothetical protein COLO4_30932 [Corchorus olitorius]|uniref:UDP-glucuronosyl/UDP-glucosyltransferase n=1 Tax=Corchorus olitorius TaxID=93759 RepID=A0A1R3H6F6_9ROSI|nr:hypothetical protein COLO4_30932 [Corchorus olitorius]
MSTIRLSEIMKKALVTSEIRGRAAEITKILTISGRKAFKENPSLLSNLNSELTNLILSNPRLPLHTCTLFYDLLKSNISPTPLKLSLQTHLTFIIRLYKAEKFREIKEVLRRGEVEKATYTALIEYFASVDKHEEVEKLFDEMRERRIEVDLHLYTSMISWLCQRRKIKRAFVLFDELNDKGLVPNAHVYGALIDGLCKTGQMEAADMLVNHMQNQGIYVNVVIFNTLLNGYCKKGMIDVALRQLAIMVKKGLQPDVFTYNIIASWMSKLKRHEEAKKWLFMMVEKGVTPNAFSFTTLIDIHCKEGNLVEAKRLFQQMEGRGLRPNNITYNALIDGYTKKGEMKDAYKLRDEMEAKGIFPDVYTYTSLVHGECSFEKVDKAMRLFNEMQQKGLVPNVVTYTAMISGLSKEGRSDEAFGLYSEMISMGHTPDQRVYSSLVLASSIQHPPGRLLLGGFKIGWGNLLVIVEAGKSDLPENCENLDRLPSRHLSYNFSKAIMLLQPQADDLVSQHKPDAIISGQNIPWTAEIAEKYGIPRLVFHGSCCFSVCLSIAASQHEQKVTVNSDTESFLVPGLPDPVYITRSHMPERFFGNLGLHEFFDKFMEAERKTYAVVANTFVEIESEYIKHYEKIGGFSKR